jgi:hypothetical protein
MVSRERLAIPTNASTFDTTAPVAMEQRIVGFTQRGVEDRAVVGVELTAQLPTPIVEMPQRHELGRRFGGIEII